MLHSEKGEKDLAKKSLDLSLGMLHKGAKSSKRVAKLAAVHVLWAQNLQEPEICVSWVQMSSKCLLMVAFLANISYFRTVLRGIFVRWCVCAAKLS